MHADDSAAPKEASLTTGQRHGAAIERRILGHEHREIEHVIARIETTAELAGNLAARDLGSALRSLLDAIQKTFLPHTEWEDEWCYPEIDRITGTPWATRLLRFEHQQIRATVQRLEADWLALRHEPSHRQLVDLRARLYTLHALVSSHFEQEERFLMPLLDVEAPTDTSILEGD
jgi:iron-sulfur cluster repair protein YtfE (RIC family)